MNIFLTNSTRLKKSLRATAFLLLCCQHLALNAQLERLPNLIVGTESAGVLSFPKEEGNPDFPRFGTLALCPMFM
jgi:hypothetical protein